MSSKVKSKFTIRSAIRADCPSLMSLKKELSIHSGVENKPTISCKDLERDGFDTIPPCFHCVVAEDEESGAVVGFGLYFYAYAAWVGKVLHLEDFCTSKSFRGQGVGSLILKELAKIAVRERCSRVQLEVGKWNESALRFYNSHGGIDTTVSQGWHNFRFDKAAIKNLAKATSTP